MPPRYLDSRVKWVWFIPTVVSLALIWMISSFAMLVFVDSAFVFGMEKFSFSVLLLIGLTFFVGLPVYLYNHIEYMSFTYEIADHEFVIRQGVLTRHTTVIPYNRIQNVNTSRTLLERVLGLATLQIETAGTNPSVSEGILPGVSKKDELIFSIMKKVERVKKSNILPNGSIKTQRDIMEQMLKELVELNSRLQDLHGLMYKIVKSTKK